MATRGRPWLLLAAELFILAAGAESFVRATRLDWKLLKPLLYYANADLTIHRVSNDDVLHFELAPGSRDVFNGGARPVTINALGFRDPPRSAHKPNGVRRIVFLGGSNTYGAAVGDGETYPSYLEALLNRQSRGRYEVWDAGVSAYVLKQNIEQARSIVRDYAPDLLVFQLSNCGRRAFLWNKPFRRFFGTEPALYPENLRIFWRPLAPWVGRWRLLGAIVFALNRVVMRGGVAGETWQNCEGMRVQDARELREFYAENRSKVRIALMIYPGGALDPILDPDRNIPVLMLKEKLPQNHGPDYLKIHPPAEVYQWYARALASDLKETGLLP